MKKINSKEEAIKIWDGLMEDISNGYPPNKELLQELEEDWVDVMIPKVEGVQDSIANWAVLRGIMTREEADKALSERKRKEE